MNLSSRFNKSLPFKLALRKLGPNAGIRWRVDTNARMENPSDAERNGNVADGYIKGTPTSPTDIGMRGMESDLGILELSRRNTSLGKGGGVVAVIARYVAVELV